MKGIVDRIEGEWVVLEMEDGKMKDIPKAEFHREVKPGDAVVHDGKKYVLDSNRTEKLKKEIQELMDDLFVD